MLWIRGSSSRRNLMNTTRSLSQRNTKRKLLLLCHKIINDNFVVFYSRVGFKEQSHN